MEQLIETENDLIIVWPLSSSGVVYPHVLCVAGESAECCNGSVRNASRISISFRSIKLQDWFGYLPPTCCLSVPCNST